MSLDNLLTATKCLNIKDNIINILLLGETGVGKSTFINYLTYSDFKKAENGKLITLIPLKCKIKDKHGEYHTIQIGPEDDQNECLEVGMSATQDVKSYVFPIWNGATKMRLIDTPGIGDVRGILQDYTNCENILSYIGELHELHAICCLFKPTNSRITNFFDYCLSQILSRLDKSASKNLIFIFTNTRGSDYGAGDTLPSLQKIINDIKARPPHVDIPLKNNVFCFDNEAFRFLAAAKENVQFDTYVKQRNCESWKRSVKQCYNLIKYIVGDSQQPPLKPHFIKSTSAINEARRLIAQLSQPLAEISQLIRDNLYALQKHKENLDLDSDTLDELRQKLYMPVIDLDVITLTLPVTVCASRKCAEIYKVGDINKWHYKQRCHDPCFLKSVPKEIVGSPELVNCAAIDSSTSACMKCHCDFSTHMHVYYMTKTVDNRIVDQNIKQNIDNKEMLLQNARKLITDISKRKDELEKEHNVIVKTCAKFAHFLQNNAIIPFSDSYKDYIEYLIIREKSLGPLSQMSVIHNLQKLLQEYEEAKQSFNDALLLQKKIGESEVLITPQKIQESIQELYKLKYNGKKIKELYECQKKSRNKEYKHSEYVHEVPCQLEEDKGKNQRRNPNQKAYHQNRQPNRAYGHQIGNGDKNVRDHSQSRYRLRDHSLPPPHSQLSHHPPDPRYQYHSRSYHPPQNHPALQYRSHINPWINHHPLNYPENQRPHSSLGHYNYRDPGPDRRYCDPNSYGTGCYRTDMDVLNKNKDGRDSYELKVVLNRPQSESPSNIPPSHLPHPRQHFRPDYYPPRTSYSPHYEDFPHYSGGGYDYYQNQIFGRPGQSQRPPQNRSNERDNSNRGRGGYRGRRGQPFPGFIKFLEYNYRDEQLAILSENVLNIFVEHEGTNGFMKEIPQNETSTVIRYHPSIPNLIAVGGENGCVTMWDTDKEEKLGCYQKHSSTVTGIGFSRNQKMMVTTGMDNKICVLDNSSSDCLFKMSIHQAVTSVDISPDDIYIAAGLEDGCICIYDIRDPLKYLICAQVHNSSVNKISFEKGPVAVESLHDGHSLTTINDSDFCDNRKAEIVNTECKNNNNFEDNLKKELFKMVKTQMNYLESQLAEHCTKFQSFINKEFDSIHNAMGRWDVFNVGDTNEIVQAIDTTDVKSTKSVSTRKSTTY